MPMILRELLATTVLPFIGVLIITLSLWDTFMAWVDSRDEAYQEFLDEFLWEEIDGRTLAYYSVAATVAGTIFGYFIFGFVGAVAFGLFCYRIPFWVVEMQIQKRHDKLEMQLELALQNLANSMRAGLTFISAVKEGGRNLPAPMSEELALIGKRYDLGKPLDEVLKDSRKRFRSHHYDLAVLAILVARQQGGNLSETLDRIGEFMREVFALDRKIRVLTAEGRISAKIVAFSPMFMGILLWIGAPDYIRPLFTDPIGGVILFIVVFLNLVGFLWIQSIVAINV